MPTRIRRHDKNAGLAQQVAVKGVKRKLPLISLALFTAHQTEFGVLCGPA